MIIEHLIIAYKIEKLKSEVEKLNKRARRLHVPEWKIISKGDPVVRKYQRENGQEGTKVYIPIKLEGELIALAGWKFLARVDHFTDEESGKALNVVAKRPDLEEDFSAYGEVSALECDHCHIKRNRNTTYVLQHETTGERKRIGSTCLKDFLGSDYHNPEKFLNYFLPFCAALSGGDYDDDEGEGGRGSRGYEGLPFYLSWVVYTIEHSGWTSGKAAYESGGALISTAQRALQTMNEYLGPDHGASDKQGPIIPPTRANRMLALRSIVWARRLEPKNDYETNVHNIARINLVPPKSYGLAASIVICYMKSRERKNEVRAQNRGLDKTATSGTLGKREIFNVRLIADPKYIEGNYGVTCLLRYLDLDNHAMLVWFGNGNLCNEELTRGWEGQLKATVKRYEEYQGTKQTLISRAKVVEKKSSIEKVAV